MSRKLIALDIELNPGHFMIGMRRFSDGKYLHIETKSSFTKDQRKQIMNVLQKYTIVTFNGIKFDMPLIYKAMMGEDVMGLYNMAQKIIKDRLPLFITLRDFAVEVPRGVDQRDIIEPSPAVFVGLKKYGTRLGSKKLQELPYAYDKVLNDAEISDVREYNKNDLQLTIELYNAIEDRINLRLDLSKQYGIDLVNKSDAQIAQTVLMHELRKLGVSKPKIVVPKSVKYDPPSYLKFDNPELQQLFDDIKNETFNINPKNGSPILPDWMKDFSIKLGDTEYKVGIGGLHAKIKSKAYIPKDDEKIIDADVVSMYPSIMIQNKFYPEPLTRKFIELYSRIYDTRVDAKRNQKKLEKEIKNAM